MQFRLKSFFSKRLFQFESGIFYQQLFTIAGLLSISSAHFYVPLHNYKAANLKVFFAHKFDIQIVDLDYLISGLFTSLIYI